jgi:hypothetical protein
MEHAAGYTMGIDLRNMNENSKDALFKYSIIPTPTLINSAIILPNIQKMDTLKTISIINSIHKVSDNPKNTHPAES